MLGAAPSVNNTPFEPTPPTLTSTLPVVALTGTGTVIEVLPQTDGLAVVPLNVTALAPCAEPKLFPEIMTTVPTAPKFGDKLVMLGVELTTKVTPLLATPPTVTTTGPVVVPDGTVTVIEAEAQLAAVALFPLKVTVLVPWLKPKFPPATVTMVPTGPTFGDRVVMTGAELTVKVTPLLATPPTVTTTGPVLAPLGTVVVIELVVHAEGTATIPLKVTVLFPWLDPKLPPAIVTTVPTGPTFGDRLVMVGAGFTVKITPLLATPPTVTTSGPVVAPVGTGTAI
jgi:hypothetical protein